MTSSLKRRAAPLLIALLLTACSASGPRLPSPSPKPVEIPSPPPELMVTPDPSSWPNVPQLFSEWTKLLEAWQAKLKACRDTPAKCA